MINYSMIKTEKKSKTCQKSKFKNNYKKSVWYLVSKIFQIIKNNNRYKINNRFQLRKKQMDQINPQNYW
jgi:hypothetical protein